MCTFCTHHLLGRATDLEQSEANKKHGMFVCDKINDIWVQAEPMLALEAEINALNDAIEKSREAEPNLKQSQEHLIAKLKQYASTETASVFSKDEAERKKARGEAMEQTRDATHELLEQGRKTAAQVADVTQQTLKQAHKDMSDVASQGMNYLRQAGFLASKPEEKPKTPEHTKAAQVNASTPKKQDKADKVDRADIKRDVAAVATSLAVFLKKPTQVNLILLQDTVDNHPEYKHDAKFQPSLAEACSMYSELDGIFPATQKAAAQKADKTTEMREQVGQERAADTTPAEKKPWSRYQ